MEQVKKITILGKEVTLKMNMAVLIGYEGLTDKTFLGETFETVRDRYALICAVLSQSPDGSPELAEQLLHESDFAEFDKVFAAVLELATEFFHVPAVVKEDEQKQEDGQGN